MESPGIYLEVALHLGTLAAIVIVFWRQLLALAGDAARGAGVVLKTRNWRLASENAPLFPASVAIVAGTFPIVVAVLAFESMAERLFENLAACGILLCVTGLILAASRFSPAPSGDRVGPGRGFVVGISQAAAVLPGISRSGATIVTGCLLGVERRTAARFSFLLAVPALAGAAVWKCGQGLSLFFGPSAADGATVPLAALGVGALISAATGVACLLFLLEVVEKGRLHWFAAYCLPAGAFSTTGRGFENVYLPCHPKGGIEDQIAEFYLPQLVKCQRGMVVQNV